MRNSCLKYSIVYDRFTYGVKHFFNYQGKSIENASG